MSELFAEIQAANKFLEFVESEKKIKLIGKARINNKDRAPTISFTLDGISSKRFSDELIKQNIES